MKQFLLIAFVIGMTSFTLSAQNYQEEGDYTFKDLNDYSAKEPKVLECANYLFSNPADENELARLNCQRYIINWMQGTDKYTFSLGQDVLKLTKGNDDLLGLYMAAMTKVALESKGGKLSEDAMFEQSADMLTAYCMDDSNNIKPSREMKKRAKE